LTTLQQTYNTQPLNFPENLASLISSVRRKIKPRFKLLPADWADANFTLPESSAKKGKWVTAEVEYTRRILNAIADPMVNEITVMTSSQILKTTMMLILITYVTDYDTSPILVLLPTISQGENFSKTKLESVIENIDALKEKIGERKSRDKRNTIMYKELPGSNFIIIVGANSPVGLAMHSVKYVFEDDIDRIPVTAGEEGDPCALAEQRTESFKLYGYKVIRFSTPTTAGRSRIEAKYKQGSREKFYVPCPHCKFMQVLRFFPLKDKDKDEWYGGLTWDKDKDLLGKTIKHHPQTTRYICEGCRKPIYEKDKDFMRSNGEWVAENPDNIKHLSFGELGRLYSSLSTWVQIV